MASKRKRYQNLANTLIDQRLLARAPAPWSERAKQLYHLQRMLQAKVSERAQAQARADEIDRSASRSLTMDATDVPDASDYLRQRQLIPRLDQEIVWLR